MFMFIVILNQIVGEKQLKLRQGMKLMGLKDSMFWYKNFPPKSFPSQNIFCSP